MRTVKLVRITVPMAKDWLKKNILNRHQDPTRIRILADDMEGDRFIETHEGVAFDEGGNLIDGQHRLEAIVLSGMPQELVVVWGVPREAIKVIDSGKPRSIADVLRIEGSRASSTHAAIAARLIMDLKPSSNRTALSRTLKIAMVKKHWDAMEFAIPKKKLRPTCNANVLAAVVCAWYTQDRSRLSAFLECLTKGIVTHERDQSAVALNRFLLGMSGKTGGGSVALEIFAKSLGALRAFLKEKPIDKVYAMTENPFPIPQLTEEEKAIFGSDSRSAAQASRKRKGRRPPDLPNFDRL
jgi:hypothetical protein